MKELFGFVLVEMHRKFLSKLYVLDFHLRCVVQGCTKLVIKFGLPLTGVLFFAVGTQNKTFAQNNAYGNTNGAYSNFYHGQYNKIYGNESVVVGIENIGGVE